MQIIQTLKKKYDIWKLIAECVLKLPKKHINRLYISIFLVALTISINISTPIIFKNILDSYDSAEFNSMTFLVIISMYGILWALGQAGLHLREILSYRAIEKSINILSVDTFSHLIKLSHNFHLTKKVGGIISSMEKSQNGIAKVLWGVLFYVLPVSIEVIAACVVLMAYFHSYLGTILLLTISGFIIFTLASTKWAVDLSREAYKIHNNSNAFAVEALMNFEVIKLFNAEEQEIDKYTSILDTREMKAARGRSAMQWIRVGQALILGIGFTLSLALVGLNVGKDQITLGDVVLINAYFIQFASPLNHLGTFYRNIKEGLMSMAFIQDILSISEFIPETTHVKNFVCQGAKIEFRNVCFSYNDQTKGLNDINFVISAGEKIGIIGETGSGKTTILKLLLRFYDPQQGKILIDDQDISQVTLSSLRSHISVVPQDTILFNSTILENISYGNHSVGLDEIEEAAKAAHIHKFIMDLPEGYATIVGERGLKLSGGEKQRLAIARALIKKPKIIIFDEATSSLDKKTESQIQKKIPEIIKDITTIIITHGQAMLSNVDRILNIKDGTISEIKNNSIKYTL